MISVRATRPCGPGDTSMVTLKEVEAVMKAKGARVIR
jgi:hypothetical protein